MLATLTICLCGAWYNPRTCPELSTAIRRAGSGRNWSKRLPSLCVNWPDKLQPAMKLETWQPSSQQPLEPFQTESTRVLPRGKSEDTG